MRGQFGYGQERARNDRSGHPPLSTGIRATADARGASPERQSSGLTGTVLKMLLLDRRVDSAISLVVTPDIARHGLLDSRKSVTASYTD
jgi:hypothetical protein